MKARSAMMLMANTLKSTRQTPSSPVVSPGVGSNEGVVGVVDAEDVDIVITNVQMNKE